MPRLGHVFVLAAAGAIAKRRRAVGVAMLAAAYSDRQRAPIGPQGPRDKDKQDRLDWDSFVRTYTDKGFIRDYRLNKTAFNNTLGLIRDLIQTANSDKALASSVGPISAAVRFAAVLRWLAGGAYQDIEKVYKMSTAELYESIWRVVSAINTRVRVHFDMSDVNDLVLLEAGFALKSRKHNWRGQVLALDGCVFRQISPGNAVRNSMKFWCVVLSCGCVVVC